MWTQACSGQYVASICLPGPDDPLLGHAGTGQWDASLIGLTLQKISPSIIINAVSYSPWDDGLNHSDIIHEVECHCQVTGAPYLQVDVADATRWQLQAIPIYPIVGIRDISLISNDESLAESFEAWTGNSYPHMAPRSFDDVLNGDILEWLSVYARKGPSHNGPCSYSIPRVNRGGINPSR